MNTLSVIVPCFNEQEILKEFYTEVTKVLDQIEQIDYELLFIDDGSLDNTINVIKEMSENDNRIRYISFSRNFGKEAAMYAGLENAKGNLAVIMDADLQHPPCIITEMYEAITREGYDMCVTRRVSRKGEPVIRSFLARCFYRFLNRISDIDLADGAQDFCMMTRPVIDSILSLKENNRFIKGIYGWIGFKKKWIEHENIERTKGETKWSFWGLLMYSLEGIMSFSTMPLMISSILGILFCLIALILIIVVCVKTIVFGEPVQGYPTLMCTICLIGGIVMLSMGIMGQYIAKMYLEVKNRPIYIVREKK